MLEDKVLFFFGCLCSCIKSYVIRLCLLIFRYASKGTQYQYVHAYSTPHRCSQRWIWSLIMKDHIFLPYMFLVILQKVKKKLHRIWIFGQLGKIPGDAGLSPALLSHYWTHKRFNLVVLFHIKFHGTNGPSSLIYSQMLLQKKYWK